jgi:hypothetical protein
VIAADTDYYASTWEAAGRDCENNAANGDYDVTISPLISFYNLLQSIEKPL